MTHDHATNSKTHTADSRLCLLTTVHPERSLSLALVQHLGEELPELQFVLEAPAGQPLQAIWVCGYKAGRGAIVQGLSEAHPEAVMVVTGRGPVASWSPEVTSAGAHFACAWPLPFRRLAELLTKKQAVLNAATAKSATV